MRSTGTPRTPYTHAARALTRKGGKPQPSNNTPPPFVLFFPRVTRRLVYPSRLELKKKTMISAHKKLMINFLFLDPPEMDQRMSRGLNKLDNTWTEHFHIPRVDTSLHSREQQKPHTRRVYFHTFTLNCLFPHFFRFLLNIFLRTDPIEKGTQSPHM
jgi:hypothetical protein